MSDLDDFNAMANSEWKDRFVAQVHRNHANGGFYVLDGTGGFVCECANHGDADVIARALNRFFVEMWRYEPREDEDLDSKFGRGSE